MNIFNENIDFQRSTNCKLLSQIKENSTNICDFFLSSKFPLRPNILITRPGRHAAKLRHWVS
jgi:hypothetical protein